MGSITRSLLTAFVVSTGLIGITSNAYAQEQVAPPQMECGVYDELADNLTKAGVQVASRGIADTTGTPLKNAVVEVWTNNKGMWTEFVIMVAPGTTTKIACIVAQGTNWMNYFSPGELAND